MGSANELNFSKLDCLRMDSNKNMPTSQYALYNLITQKSYG